MRLGIQPGTPKSYSIQLPRQTV